MKTVVAQLVRGLGLIPEKLLVQMPQASGLLRTELSAVPESLSAMPATEKDRSLGHTGRLLSLAGVIKILVILPVLSGSMLLKPVTALAEAVTASAEVVTALVEPIADTVEQAAVTLEPAAASAEPGIEMSTNEAMALADIGTTALALAQGAIELNPLGPLGSIA